MSAASNERLEEEKEKLVMFMEKIDKLSDTSNQLKEDMEHFRMQCQNLPILNGAIKETGSQTSWEKYILEFPPI